MLSLTTPLEAYRADLANNPGRGALTTYDAKLLSLGTLLHRLTQLGTRDIEASGTMLKDATDLALELARDTNPDTPTLSAAIRSAMFLAEEQGALCLANVMLHLVSRADSSLSVIEKGRLLAQRARVARIAGAYDQASVLYEETMVLGVEAGLDELVARAHIGYALLARTRGNHPEARAHLEQATAPARKSGHRDVMRMVHQESMANAATARQFDEAAVHAWAAFQASRGNHADESEALVNVAQALLDSGRARLALHTYGALLSRKPSRRLVIPALGGAVRAASEMGLKEMVLRLVAEIDRHATGAGLRVEVVEALGDAAMALRAFEPEEGERRRAAALAEARQSGFHELVFRLEHVETDEPRLPAATASRDVAHVLREAGRLPVAAEYALA